MTAKIAALFIAGGVSFFPLVWAEEPRESTRSPAPGEMEEPARLTSEELLRDTPKWDGKDIVFRGEAIGDIMRRGEFVWLNLQDDFGTIGVWAPRDMARGIQYTGDYRHKGDTIEIEGKFFRADPKLAGELCIRAQRLTIVNPGNTIARPLHPLKIEIAVLFFIGALILGLFRIFMKRRGRPF